MIYTWQERLHRVVIRLGELGGRRSLYAKHSRHGRRHFPVKAADIPESAHHTVRCRCGGVYTVSYEDLGAYIPFFTATHAEALATRAPHGTRRRSGLL